MIRQKTDAELDLWITAASASLIASFAKGIAEDAAAVRAAMTTSWSNGQTEGQITKLKMVKRQMYGRANIDLLHAYSHSACFVAVNLGIIISCSVQLAVQKKIATVTRDASVQSLNAYRVSLFWTQIIPDPGEAIPCFDL